MWFANDIVTAVERVARIRYVDKINAQLWNQNRRDGELRLLTGWSWTAKGGSGKHRQGFKTMSAAYRDAYYALIQHIDAPGIEGIKIVRKTG